MQRSVVITLLAGSAIAVSGAIASAKGQGPDFATLDSDGDGQITLSEMQARGDARFDDADGDGDGFLSVAELDAAAAERAKARSARMIERLDADADGRISRAEMRETRRDPARLFQRIDADDNGAISQDEFEQARGKMRPRRAGKPRGDQ